MAVDLNPKRYGSKALAKGAEITGEQIMSVANAITATKKANSVIDSYNSFITAVETDTSGENIFNAASFFDERKKQAEELKQRAAALSEYMANHQDSYTQESYDELMGILSTFDTNVDDIMSRYQPSLDSKAGMAAYEDEFIAAMERNEQLRKNQQAATFGVDPMYQNLGVFDSFFRQSTDNSKQAVTDNWTAEQRYNLGHYQNTDPAMARKYAELVNAGKDPLTIAAQQEAEKASMLAVDLKSEKKEIDRMKAELENIYWNSNYDATSASDRAAFDQEIKRREKEISDREQKYNLAKRAQESEQFRSAADRSDFDAKSGYVDSGFTMPTFVEDADPDELVYEYINNQNGVRSKVDGENISLASKGYDLLNEDEVALYNYYYATEGPAKAQQYLDNIQETLNYRMGERIAQSKSGDLWKQYLSAAVTGYSGAVSGLQNLFNEDEYIPASAFQQASGMIREDLAEAGKLPEFYGDTSLGQIGYDLISTTANMAPSIAAGSLFGPIAGAATMGASAAGNAYQQALNNGYTKEQARTYAALTGASEVGLEYVLGGISKLGGEIPQQIIKNMVSGVDNAVARAAITLGGSMVSEGFEEGLQEVITPWIENLTLYADKDVNWDEVAYSTLLGALSGGFMEGPGVIANTAGVTKVDKQFQNLGATEDISETPVQTPRVSTDGKAIQISTNEAIEALDFASLNKGKATIQLKSGETADYSDVSFASDAEANQFYSVASLPGIDTENANDLLHTIQEADAGKDVDSVVGIREAYGIGYFGMQESDLEIGDAGKLTPELRKAVFDIGRRQRAADAMVKATAKPVTAKPSAGYKKVVFDGKTRQITKKQKSEIEFVDYIAENFSGNTVHVFESYKGNDGRYYYRDNNGKVHRAPNGKYVNGEIWLDLKSGDNQEGLVLNTFAHEMYHHIEKFDKTKAQELAEFVSKELGKKSVDDAVAEQIKKARKAGLGERYFQSRGMTAEQARNEVYMRAMSDFVADSLETMFTRGDPAKAIANLKKENRTLFDEIKAFIDKWVSKLKEFYSDKTISKEGEMVAQLEKFEQLQQLFMEGVQSAGENYRAALSELTPGEAGEIVKENADPVAASIKDQDAYSLRNEKPGKKESGKSYKAEQKDLIQKMQTEKRLIREELTGKKSDISIMEKEFIRLAKQYERLDTKTGKQSAKDARAITQLRTALKEEAKSHREDSKIWEREFNRLLRDYDTAGRQIDRLEATIQRQRATAKARVEGRRNTEMRHKIQRKVNELDQLLRHGSKHRNVPEFLQSSVAEVLNAINMEVRDGDQRRKTYEANLARYDRQIAAATDPATVSRLIEKRNEYAAKGDQFANRMDTLKKAYDQIRKENTGLELDEGIAEHLNSLFETVGDTPLGQMSAEQLDAVNDILNVTMSTVRNANQMLAEGRTAGVVETSKSAITEIKSAGETKKKKTRFRKGLEQFGWNNLKPEYAIEVIGSKTLKARYDALRKGEDTLAVDLNEAKKFVQEQWKKNGGKDWDMDQKFTFTSTSGKSFELNLDQIMNLYALAKDKDARSHLRVGGFAFDNNYQTEENINLGPVKIPVKMESTDASAYNLSDEILGEIISKLSPEQRAFADAMQAYLSDTMAAKGNEVSLKKYGIRLFKKKDYFPIRVADQFMAKAREQQAGDRKLKDAGFTKDRKPEAKNPVVLSGFMKTWAEHVDEMSLYHSFVLPLDDFNRVLNYHDAFVEGEQAHSVVEAITNAFGEGAVKYLDQLIKDVNGGIKGGSTVSFANRMMSKAKKAQTMASLSVAIQQPSSILRSMSEVDLKYFLGPKVTEKSHDRTWDEIKVHAPIAIIKEMGGYDTNVGKSTVDYLTDTAEYNGFGEKFKAMFTDEKFRDDALGRLPALMDEMSWGVIWNAVKREQADQHPNMDAKSDAFMKLVAKRFTEVITRTQVYDSVFSRSGLMRDRKSDLAKMTTSFMAEPTTTANMLAVSILQAKRGDIPKKQAVKTTASIVASLALNAALVSVVYAMRDDDEDKRYDEKWIENFYSNFFESLNPVGYIPYVRDIYNLFVKGYDVERADMELFGDLQNAIDGLDNDDLSAWEKTENVIGAIGNLVGVPLKNILRDSRGVAKTIAIALDKESKDRSTKTGKYMARRGMDLSDGEEMILALQRGDEEHIQRVFGRFETQQKAESALQSAIGEQYKNGKLTAEEAEELLNTAFEREDEQEVYWIMDKWNYAIENGNSEGYTKYGKLYEAIENGGDYTAEMDRLTEHGSEASEIRSQITKKYHKQYLEGDEATQKEIRDKITPVLEAAGLDESEIEEKFSSWDFEVEYGMTYSEFKAEYRDGNVTENEMRNAMKFTGMMNYEIEEDIRSLNEEIKFVNKYDMTLTEMKDAYDNGDISPNQMTSALVFDGMTQKEAKAWVKQRDIENRLGIDYMEWDDAYKYGDISRETFYNAMIQNGGEKKEIDEAILSYDWLKKHVKQYPDLASADGKKFAVRIHADYAPDETLEDYGVSIDAYLEYKKLRPECKGVDMNGDGKTDDGTLRDSVFRMIDSLPISKEAKDGLALMSYSRRSILKNAPWH